MSNSCMICGGAFHPAFAKTFDWEGLGKVHYERCLNCGFVRAKELATMDAERWSLLNRRFHEQRESVPGRASVGRWMQRLNGYCDALGSAARLGMLPNKGRWLDYGAGDGALADLLADATGRRVSRYEPFMKRPHVDETDLSEIETGSCDLVLNTAMLEHLRDRSPIDQIGSLLSRNGVLALHTVVPERVPDDPDWFYLLPVHCAFFTNAAMALLCKQLGFVAGAYAEEQRLWLLSRAAWKSPPAESIDGGPPWFFADGWVHYWT